MKIKLVLLCFGITILPTIFGSNNEDKFSILYEQRYRHRDEDIKALAYDQWVVKKKNCIKVYNKGKLNVCYINS
ncbi:hypothetical protein FLACOL7796_01823 [Flavobacterium collinsii]|uniref:Uncharacterized protein n=1 Tax=Flavobacterium collinsii TaxID=1114861 RepID=A0ABN7EI93_9FLAO|nr:hypothetical protein FLACOL7796_01823 [Flavobacterium collinsii]